MNHTSTVALGEIFNIARGGSPRPIKNYITDDPDGVNWIMIGDTSENDMFIRGTQKRIVKEGVKRSRMVYPGDFLLTNSMSFGRPYITKVEGCIHDGWLVLSPKEDNVDPIFLYYLLGSKELKSAFNKKAAGAVVKNLNINLVKSVEVNLPPLTEQKRIAAILDKADAIRRKRQDAIALADTFLRSVFLKMFGDPVTNPMGWNQVLLKDVASIGGGVTKGKKYKGLELVDVPYMRVANVQDGWIDTSEMKTISVSHADAERYSMEKGDLLLTEGGDPDKLGRGAVWDGSISPCIHQNHIFKVRFDTSIVLPEFASFLIGSIRGKRYFLRAAKQTTGIATINKTQLSNFEMLVPGLELQKQFQTAVQSAKSTKQKLEQISGESNNLFSSLQQRAFRGDL